MLERTRMPARQTIDSRNVVTETLAIRLTGLLRRNGRIVAATNTAVADRNRPCLRRHPQNEPTEPNKGPKTTYRHSCMMSTEGVCTCGRRADVEVLTGEEEEEESGKLKVG